MDTKIFRSSYSSDSFAECTPMAGMKGNLHGLLVLALLLCALLAVMAQPLEKKQRPTTSGNVRGPISHVLQLFHCHARHMQESAAVM
jgi:hypothetical protein